MMAMRFGFTVRRIAAIWLLAVVAVMPAQAQPSAKDAIGIPGPISFNGKDYALAWSSRPSPQYYKQEYVPAGQNPKTYTEMLLVEAVTADIAVEKAAASQIEMLKKRKASDPVVNYQILRNNAKGEVILDFILSDRSGATLIVEWNAYRYTKRGKGIALFAVSRRGYGEDGNAFLTRLKSERLATIDALAKMPLPPITPVP